MKRSFRNAAFLTLLALGGAARADVVYSNLRDTTIPADFTGLFVDVDGNSAWDLNPFFGGVGVANTSEFQPARLGTGNLDAINGFAAGDVIDVSRLFSSGYGGSQTHLGSTFTSGQEGYLGFRLNGNFGWMRVVFTANTPGAVIKDWAYETDGTAIRVGRVRQSAPASGAQLVTLSPGSGESFTLGSALTDTGGNVNSLLKNGGGTTILGGTNTYTGDTTVAAGVLLVNGSLGSSQVGVAGASLGGTGVIGGSVTVASGTLSPGASIESLATGSLSMASGTTFVYEMANTSSTGADLLVVSGSLSLSGVDLVVSGADLGTWLPGDKVTLIGYDGTPIASGFLGYNDDSDYVFGSNTWRLNYNDTTGGSNYSGEQTGTSFVTLTMVPEPTAPLLVLLGLAAGWRRRRA